MRVAFICCLAAVLLVPASVRADLITPDTIVRPPPTTLNSANGTPVVWAADLVSNQYATAGLVFPPQPGPVPGVSPTVVITSLGGVSVWAPALTTEAVADRAAVIDYRGTITGQLSHPAGGLSVEVIGPFGETLSASDSHGHLLGFANLSGPTGPHGGTLLTIEGQDISTFVVTGPLLMDVAGTSRASVASPQPWGIAEVQTPVTHAPEPSAWLLAVLGVLGTVTLRGRGRPRTT
jgi:hypothetical protein